MIQIIKTIVFNVLIFMITVGASIFWTAILFNLIERIKFKIKENK